MPPCTFSICLTGTQKLVGLGADDGHPGPLEREGWCCHISIWVALLDLRLVNFFSKINATTQIKLSDGLDWANAERPDSTWLLTLSLGRRNQRLLGGASITPTRIQDGDLNKAARAEIDFGAPAATQ